MASARSGEAYVLQLPRETAYQWNPLLVTCWAQDLNIVLQRIDALPDDQRFDLVIATNILVSYEGTILAVGWIVRRITSSVTWAFLLSLALSPAVLRGQRTSTPHPAARKPLAPTPERALDGQMLALQVGLDRAGFSPGEIDGRGGANTNAALSAFRATQGLPAGDAADKGTMAALRVDTDQPITTYLITEQDVAGPFIGAMPTDMMEETKLPALGYTSPLEALGERFHSSPDLLRGLNPHASFQAGETISVPSVRPFDLPGKSEKTAAKAETAAAAEVVISVATKSLTVRDASGRTIMYAPVTIGSEKDPLPVGDWKVVGVSWNPIFNYNPELFWDADPSHAKAKIAAGPNNPVGVVWIDINKEHFGLHGTAEPSTVGKTQSHGCVRLTNWDALKVAHLVSPGTKVVLR